MRSEQNKMDNNPDDQLIISQANIESNRQDYDYKMKNLTADLTKRIASIMDQIKISKSSPDKKDSPKAQDTTTVVTTNNKASPLEGVNYTNNVGMWTLMHEIILPTLYELLIKT